MSAARSDAKSDDGDAKSNTSGDDKQKTDTRHDIRVDNRVVNRVIRPQAHQAKVLDNWSISEWNAQIVTQYRSLSRDIPTFAKKMDWVELDDFDDLITAYIETHRISKTRPSALLDVFESMKCFSWQGLCLSTSMRKILIDFSYHFALDPNEIDLIHFCPSADCVSPTCPNHCFNYN